MKEVIRNCFVVFLKKLFTSKCVGLAVTTKETKMSHVSKSKESQFLHSEQNKNQIMSQDDEFSQED